MKSIQQQLWKLFKDKDILFLENDLSLNYSAKGIENWLIENRIKYNVLYRVSELSMEYIKEMIDWYDVIVFQTTWTYERSHEIEAMMKKMTDRKKVVVECYIKEPSWYCKPNVIHDLYVIYSDPDEEREDWELKQVKRRYIKK